mmetsp:Transcript_23351/g.29854  ORF Transcript_23351/g.29854 Transcript_23351/m.29854 type:complete len:229 (+) Transcript_23351:181-867(+)
MDHATCQPRRAGQERGQSLLCVAQRLVSRLCAAPYGLLLSHLCGRLGPRIPHGAAVGDGKSSGTLLVLKLKILTELFVGSVRQGYRKGSWIIVFRQAASIEHAIVRIARLLVAQRLRIGFSQPRRIGVGIDTRQPLRAIDVDCAEKIRFAFELSKCATCVTAQIKGFDHLDFGSVALCRNLLSRCGLSKGNTGKQSQGVADHCCLFFVATQWAITVIRCRPGQSQPAG